MRDSVTGELRRSGTLRTRSRCAACLLLLLTAPSCEALEIGHMIYAGEHPWHQWPGTAAAFTTFVTLSIVCSPLIVAEETQHWGSIFHAKTNPGVSGYLVGVPTLALGYVVAFPFFVVGLPFEFWPHGDEPPPPQSDPPPADPQADK